MTLGLFIGRLNPPHIWHIGIIKRALKENDKVLVLLWVPLINNENNPFDFEFRKELLLSLFNKNKLNILELKDDKSDLIWIKNIKNILENYFNWIKNIRFYGWDFENDSAYKVIKEFEKEFENYNIKYILESRKNSFINYNWKNYKISATNLRKALKDWNIILSKKLCDEKIFDLLKGKLI